MKHSTPIIPVSILVALFLPVNVFSKIIYVSQQASGANDGTSWVNAYTSLYNAMLAAGSGDSVWVASGTYLPHSTDRTVSFRLRPGVRMFGGFTGVETSLDQRDWTLHPTILSGDIGQPNVKADNSYNVLSLKGTFNISLTVVDGFIICEGRADGFGPPEYQAGGGMFVNSDFLLHLEVRNCLFKDNYAGSSGGALACGFKFNSDSRLTVQNCIFKNNESGYDGGAVFTTNAAKTPTPGPFIDCVFENNYAGRNGGAVFMYEYPVPDTSQFIRCLFRNNTAQFLGGAIAHIAGRNNGLMLSFRECDFEGNQAKNNGAAIWHEPTNLSYTNFIDFKNCRFTRNTSKQNMLHLLTLKPYDGFPLIPRITFDSCHFEDNDSLGLLILLEMYGELSFKNTVFENNHIQNGNRLILLSLESQESSNPRFENVVFRRNGAQAEQPLMTFQGKSVHFINSLFFENKGLLFYRSNNVYTDTLVGCVIYGNETGASTLKRNANISLINSVLQDSQLFDRYPLYAANIFLENCFVVAPDCGALPPGYHCGNEVLFGDAPGFADAAQGNFHLSSCSPLLEAGIDSITTLMGIQTDLGGNARIQNQHVDIGAYEGPQLGAAISLIQPASCGGADGELSISLQNGCEPFQVYWSNGTLTGSRLDSLPGGSYTLTITDANGVSAVATALVPENAYLSGQLLATDYECETATGGTLAPWVPSGHPPYTYLWSTGVADSLHTGLLPGTYSLTLTDDLGCLYIDSAEVATTGSLALELDIKPIFCHGANDGQALVNPTHAAAPVIWHWNDGSSDSLRAQLGPGFYAVTVTDAAGCTSTLEFDLPEPQMLSLQLSADSVRCHGQVDGKATAFAEGGTPPYHFLWSSGHTQPIVEGLAAGTYALTVTDFFGCKTTSEITILQPLPLMAVIDATERLCYGAGATGEATALAWGGTPGYQYQWPTAHVGPTISNLLAGQYAVTVTDAHGCSTTVEAHITEAKEYIQAIFTITDASSEQNTDGGIELLDVFGSWPPYTFAWSNGDTTQSVHHLAPGFYTLTITDDVGCTEVFYFTVGVVTGIRTNSGPLEHAIVAPNPSGDAGVHLLVESLDFLWARLEVFDEMGRRVWSTELHIPKGHSIWALPEGLPSGRYHVALRTPRHWVVLPWLISH